MIFSNSNFNLSSKFWEIFLDNSMLIYITVRKESDNEGKDDEVSICGFLPLLGITGILNEEQFIARNDTIKTVDTTLCPNLLLTDNHRLKSRRSLNFYPIIDITFTISIIIIIGIRSFTVPNLSS